MNLNDKINFVLKEKSSTPPAPRNLGPADILPTRSALLEWLYAKGVVEGAPFSAHIADKLFFGKLTRTLLPNSNFVPRCFALHELPDTPAARKELFPSGYVIKPTGEMASIGNFYLDGEDFFSSGETLPSEPCVNRLTGLISSGEKYFAQEKIGSPEREYRLHTLENSVVKGATYTRWDQDWDPDAFTRAEKALDEFLNALPPWFTAREAWGLDVIERDDGSFGLVEVNTNRGMPRQWSGDLPIPDTLQAYVLHVEENYGAKFLGEAGEMLRNGTAGEELYHKRFNAESRARHAALKARFQQGLQNRI